MFSGKDCQPTIRFVGEQWKDKLGAGILLKNKEKDRVTGPESFPAFAICILLRGKGEYVDWETQKHYPLEAGNYFLRIPGTVHQIRIDLESQWLECFLGLGYHSYPYFRTFCGISPEHPVGRFTPDEAWMQKYFELKKDLKEFPEQFLLDLIPRFFELAITALREFDSRDPAVRLMEEACKFLCSDFKHVLDLKKFCRDHGWGYENFRKRFAEIIGISPNRYRLKRRLDAARALLLQKQMSVRIIAQELGYKTSNEFSMQFKKNTGMTPSEFRQQNQYMLE